MEDSNLFSQFLFCTKDNEKPNKILRGPSIPKKKVISFELDSSTLDPTSYAYCVFPEKVLHNVPKNLFSPLPARKGKFCYFSSKEGKLESKLERNLI